MEDFAGLESAAENQVGLTPEATPLAYPDIDPEQPQIFSPVEAEQRLWLGQVMTQPATAIEVPAASNLIKARYPVHLEEGLEKEFVQFCGVLKEVILDVIMPFDMPRSELTSHPKTGINGQGPEGDRKPSIHEYF